VNASIAEAYVKTLVLNPALRMSSTACLDALFDTLGVASLLPMFVSERVLLMMRGING
jgi:hypothetical protein